MPKYKVLYDKVTCIGAASCVAVAPKFWELVGDKAQLIGSTYNESTKKFELLIETAEDLQLNQDAEAVCPVAAIKVEKVSD
ncbi:ferredoxin [Candidatus Woesearchaeota archaeon]|nr:ferredoxin [Candidatus Woesearchaeota archaeon]